MERRIRKASGILYEIKSSEYKCSMTAHLETCIFQMFHWLTHTSHHLSIHWKLRIQGQCQKDNWAGMQCDLSFQDRDDSPSSHQKGALHKPKIKSHVNFRLSRGQGHTKAVKKHKYKKNTVYWIYITFFDASMHNHQTWSRIADPKASWNEWMGGMYSHSP